MPVIASYFLKLYVYIRSHQSIVCKRRRNGIKPAATCSIRESVLSSGEFDAVQRAVWGGQNQ